MVGDDGDVGWRVCVGAVSRVGNVMGGGVLVAASGSFGRLRRGPVGVGGAVAGLSACELSNRHGVA